MGYYINQNSKGEELPPKGKLKALLEDGAKIVDGKTFQENLVCVLENPLFDAAGFAYSEKEMEQFNYPCGRKKTWVVYDNAKTISGYEQ